MKLLVLRAPGLNPQYPAKLHPYTGMNSAKKYRTRAATRVTPAGKISDEIQCYFKLLQEILPGVSLSAPRRPARGAAQEAQTPDSGGTCPSTPTLPVSHPDSTAEPHQGGMSTPQLSDAVGIDQDIWALLQALPTRTDIEALILCLEETHRRDIYRR